MHGRMHGPERPLRAAPSVCHSGWNNCHKGPARRAPLCAEPLEAVTSRPVTSSLTAANPVAGLVVGSVVPTTFQRTHIPIGFRRSRTGHQWSTRSPLRYRITGDPSCHRCSAATARLSPCSRSCPEPPSMAADRPRQEGRQEGRQKGRQDAPLDAPQFVLIIAALARGTSYSQPRRQPGIRSPGCPVSAGVHRRPRKAHHRP